MQEKLHVIYTKLPTLESAHDFAQQLLENGYAGCCNYLPISCMYLQNNTLHPCTEVGLIIMTEKSKVEKIKLFIENNHPYDVPCFLDFSCLTTNEFYQFICNGLERK